MNLRMTSYGNYLRIKGSLNKRNIDLIKNEIDTMLEREQGIVINVEDVEHIDRYGIKVLIELHKDAIKNRKNVSTPSRISSNGMCEVWWLGTRKQVGHGRFIRLVKPLIRGERM